MRRKWMAMLCAMWLGISSGQSVQAEGFSDLAGNSHEQAIEALVEQNIINGYEDGTFRPNNAVTRNTVVKLLGRWMQANGYAVPEDAAQVSRFEDVALTNDVELAQLAALVQEEGVFVGAEGFLNGANTMQRQHMAVVLVRAIDVMYGIDLVAQYKEAQFTSAIQDLALAGDEEKMEAIVALEYAQITTVETFQPTNTVTRAQFASFLHRAMDYVASQQLDEAGALTEVDLTGVTSITIQDRAVLYASQNMKHTVGLWRDAARAVPFEVVNGAVVKVMIGNEAYYIKASDVTAASDVASEQQPHVGAVRTASYYRITDAPDGNIIVEGTRQTKLFVTGIEGAYYTVQLGGQQAYIAIAQTTLSSRMPLTVATDTPYLNTALKAVGQLAKGFTFTASGSTSQYMKLASNDGVYHVSRQALVEGNGANSLVAPEKGQFVTKIVAQHDAAVMNRDGVKIGVMAKGQVYELLNMTDTMGIVQFAGGAAYVRLADFVHTNQVVPSQNISYDEMAHHMNVFAQLYPEFTELVAFGESTEGRTLYALRIGNGKKEILMDASIHAREHMTTNVLMEMIDAYSYAYVNGQSYGGYNVQALLNETSIWFVPMMNPDAVTLVQGGLAAAKDQAAILKLNENSRNVGRWKANIRGVDLNRNFDGGWNRKETAAKPLYKNFKGYSVFSEVESQHLRDFIASHSFASYISWHSSGQIIYWAHDQTAAEAKRDKALAQRVANVTGYSLVPPQAGCCSGASTDWFIQTYDLPALTMEIAPYAGEGPVPLSRWADVWKRNDTVGLLAATEANSR